MRRHIRGHTSWNATDSAGVGGPIWARRREGEILFKNVSEWRLGWGNGWVSQKGV